MVNLLLHLDSCNCNLKANFISPNYSHMCIIRIFETYSRSSKNSFFQKCILARKTIPPQRNIKFTKRKCETKKGSSL